MWFIYNKNIFMRFFCSLLRLSFEIKFLFFFVLFVVLWRCFSLLIRLWVCCLYLVFIFLWLLNFRLVMWCWKVLFVLRVIIVSLFFMNGLLVFWENFIKIGKWFLFDFVNWKRLLILIFYFILIFLVKFRI